MRPGEAPRGPDQVTRALVAACERLCATRKPRLVTVRDVAAEAGVTTGLVHHYFESKEQLLAITARSIATDIDTAARSVLIEGGDMTEALRTAWRVLDERPAFRSIVLSWVIEQKNATELMGEYPFIRTLARSLEMRSAETALTRTGAIATLLLAGHLVPGVNRALGRDSDDTAVKDELERLIIDLAR